MSQTIYCFEAWSIEFASGWGKLGSNPFEISRHLERKKVSYRSYNWVYRSHSLEGNKLYDFNDGSRFIVGYMVWK